MTVHSASAHRPLISLVVSVYNVEEYLSEFLDSVDALEVDSDDLELIFVVDGSPDRSESLIREWIAGSRLTATVHVKTNGGLSSARNAGMDVATGEWISFPDPDDALSIDYLSRLVQFMRSDQAPGVSMIAARLLQFITDVRDLTVTHPLDFRFDQPIRIARLEESPKYFHLHSASGFYRLDVIREAGISFDERVRPVFEDGVFTATYLLLFEHPAMAYVSEAEYFYRKRENQSSLTGEAWGKPGKYADVIEYGHLKLLRSAGPRVPRWLQYLVFYDLQWYPKADERNQSETAGVSDELLEHFHKLLIETLQYIDDDSIWWYNATGVAMRFRLGFLNLKNGSFPVQPVHVVKLDQAQQLMLIRYYSCAADPSEVVRYSGEAVEPAYTKTTSLVYFGRPWLYQRELWVSAVRDVSVEIDGASCRLTVGPQFAPGYESNVVNVWKRLARSEPPTNDHESTGARSTSAAALPTTSPSLQPAAAPSSAAAAPSPAPAAAPDAEPGTAEPSARRLSPARPKGTGKLTPTRRATRRVKALLRRIGIEVSRTRPDTNVPRAPEPVEEGPAAVVKRARSANSRARYANAWVLIDRDTMAHDNAEALYRYLVENEPEINAWFVLSRSSTDWERLQRDGFRLVEHGSAEHVVLMKNADYLLSSQIDEYVVKPYDDKVYGKGHWKYVFLQHGVTHNDLSRWINPKPIELMITATEKETDAIVADRSPYVWSRKEVKLTGFPRHDSLLRKSRELDDATPRTLVMMPTWRDDLQVRSLGGHYRELRPDFAGTQYAREWGGLLGSDALREIAGRHRLRIQFAPHPNLQLHGGAFDLPADVELIRYRDVDIQHVLACARVLVTDYSSLAFEAAYLKTPVVYFQFDRADFFSGRHAVRRGTFSYEHDGFGPVVTNQDSALDAIATMLDTDSDRRRFYDDRLESAFPPRDGLASARLVQVIRDAEKPFSRQTCRSRARSDRRHGGLDHDQPVRGLPGVGQSHHEVRRLDHEDLFDGGNPLTKPLHPFEVV